MRPIVRIYRSAMTVVLFMMFGIGGLILSFLVLPFVRSRRAALGKVRAALRFAVRLFTGTGLIGVDSGNLENVRGCIVAPNHPSLIDVVILTALLPDTFSVAKHSLRRNPFIGRVARKAFLPDDASLLDVAQKLLASGANLLIFPEGTRTPPEGLPATLRRGTAQLSIRTGAPILPVRIDTTRRILGKHQSILDMGDRRVLYAFTARPPLTPAPDANTDGLRHREAKRLTAALLREISGEPAGRA